MIKSKSFLKQGDELYAWMRFINLANIIGVFAEKGMSQTPKD